VFGVHKTKRPKQASQNRLRPPMPERGNTLLHDPERYGRYHVMIYLSHHILLERVWKECTNSDDQQFHQDVKKNEQPPL